MIAKLPYRSVWDVTPCTIRLNAGGYTEDGEPMEAHSWTGKVNFSERAGRIQDKDGVWVKLSGVIHVKGDIRWVWQRNENCFLFKAEKSRWKR